MDTFFAKLKNRHFGSIGLACFLASEIVFMLGWGGAVQRSNLKFLNLAPLIVVVTTTFYYFKNLFNDNPMLGGGIKLGIVSTFLLLATFFSTALFFI